MNLIKAITFLLCSTLLVGQTTPIRNPQIQGASGSIVSGATLTNSGTISGAGTFNFGSGTVTMPATQILTNVTLNGTITFADNIKQTFNPGATYVGINVGSYAGVPSTLANGDIWYDSVADALKARISNATVSLGAGGGGGGSTTFAALTDVNLTTLASGDMLKWDGADWINRTAANVRSDLGLVIGTNVQAWGAKLDTISALANGAGVLTNDGSGAFSYTAFAGILAPASDEIARYAANGALGVGSGGLYIGGDGAGNSTLDLIDGATTFIRHNNADNTFSSSLVFPAAAAITSNFTINIPAASGTMAVSASGNIAVSAAGNITFTGNLPVTNLNSGTSASSTTFWRGDGTWAGAQPLDATLTALAALNNTKGTLAQTGSDTFTRLQTPVNVKVYGATGDARKVTDGVANGTTTVTSATASFTSADVGKIIWATDTSGATLFSGRTIASVTNSTDIVISGAALGSATGMQMIFGTDDTAAIQAAASAADAMSPKGCVEVPSGGYIFSDVLFSQVYASGTDTYAIRGDGSISTVFFPTPDHALTNSAIFNYGSNSQMAHISGITVDGIDVTYAGSPHATYAMGGSIWTDVRIRNIRGVADLTYAPGSDVKFIACRWEFSSYVGVLVPGRVSFYDCYSGNHGYIPLQISSSGTVIWEIGILDESSGPSIYNEGDLKINNAIVYAGGNQNACQMAGTSTLRSINTQFIPYASNNNVTGLLVAAGCTARLANCILTGSGTGYGLNNSGTVYDVGGNTFTTTTGTAPVDALSSIVSVAHGGTGASSLANLITLTTDTTGNYVADVAGTSNEITSTHTPGEGSTATLSLPATIDLGGKTSFEIPNGAAPTVDAFGEIAGDNDLWAASRGAPVFFDGTAATALVNVLVSDTPSNGQVPVWNTGGTITWEANGSGSVATDTIFDAKGDLAVGTGSNTASKLTAGTNGYVLTADSGEATGLKWAAASGGGASSVWIGAGEWIPRTTNGVGVDSGETTTNDNNFDYITFDAGATNEGAQVTITLPDNYAGGTVTATFFWTASSGSGTVIWSCAARSLEDDLALDTAAGTAQTVTDTLITAEDMHISSATGAITIAGTPATHTPIIFTITRDSGTDTLAVDARLIGVEINY